MRLSTVSVAMVTIAAPLSLSLPVSAQIYRPPGTEGLPQQETPNEIQVPINPDDTPSPDTNINLLPARPSTRSAPLPENTQPSTDPALPEPQVLVSEVLINTQQGQLLEELQNQVYKAIRTQPGRTTTRSGLQEDINAIFATGFFSNVRAQPEDTPIGVRVTFVVQPNPVLRDVQVQANPGTNVQSVLPEKVVDDTFRQQYGSILNLRNLQEGIKRLNKWYQDNGYVLAQTIEAPQVASDGTVTLTVAEGVVQDIEVRFVTEGETTNDKGEPITGRTREFIITRELELEPGEVFNRNTVQRDLQRVFRLGLFEDVNVSLNPGTDPRQVVVVVNVDERNSGSVNLTGGVSSANGVYGGLSYQQENLGGNNQKLATELQVATSQRELLFDVRFTDPWIAGDPYRTSYTVNGFRRRSTSLIFDGSDDQDIEVGDDDDRPRISRLGGGVTFTRPLSRNTFAKAEWIASAGLEYQRISIRDGDGDIGFNSQGDSFTFFNHIQSGISIERAGAIFSLTPINIRQLLRRWITVVRNQVQAASRRAEYSVRRTALSIATLW
jgi:outer membrane protein insertion porin family